MPAPRRSNRAYRNVARVLRPLLFAMTRPDWRGVEHLPTDHGFIAAANHMTNVDPLTFAHYLYDNGITPKILAKSSLFGVPVVGAVLRATGQIPVYRNTAQAGDSLRAAVDAVAAGDCVAVFPEGTLTRDPDLWPMVGKTGVARLALTTRAPVVPIAQWGPQDLLGQYKKVLKPFPRKRVTVVAGPPVDLDDLYGRPLDTATLREATERVMAAITLLLEGLRGQTAPAVRFDVRRAAARAGAAVPDDDDAVVGPAAPGEPGEERPTTTPDGPTSDGPPSGGPQVGQGTA
ncbi:1-acyl-sn-glycerol-3-phosphate acyltransferase [uncultured Cellulomonas sp.]|uniref:lysophospholipid acyltransferase family protein n=1 Tax=uncultured Cellulomonas sp. TaxID=189682 RepID=UPI002625067C|nr:lysophospholipid acyltransferase family protein [uncultured Cellulomonas sp.]